MLEIGGRPILEHNVRLAAKHGITDLVINLHHGAQLIVDHFGNGSAFGVSIRYSREPELLGTAGALNPLRETFAAATFAVLYGDNLTTCDLSAVVRRHRAAGAVATVALFHRDDPAAGGIAALDDAGLVTRFSKNRTPKASSATGSMRVSWYSNPRYSMRSRPEVPAISVAMSCRSCWPAGDASPATDDRRAVVDRHSRRLRTHARAVREARCSAVVPSAPAREPGEGTLLCRP
jgi:choline kinase